MIDTTTKKKSRKRTYILFLIETLTTFPVVHTFVCFIGLVIDWLKNNNNNPFSFDAGEWLKNIQSLGYILISLLLSSFFWCFLLYQLIKIVWLNPSKIAGKSQKSDSEVMGNARFMSEEEMKKEFGKKTKSFLTTKYNYYDIDKNKAKLIETDCPHCGWVISSKIDKNALNYLIYTKDVNVVTIGSPGTGKTQYFLLPNIIVNARSKEKPMMIINDVKGELFEQSSQLLHELGYEVKQINLRDERKSARINPLKVIWNTYQNYIRKFKVSFTNENGEVTDQDIIFNTDAATTSSIVNEVLRFELNSKDYRYITLQLLNKNLHFKIKEDTSSINSSLVDKGAEMELKNEATTFYIYENDKCVNEVSIFKESKFIDKVTTEILIISHTFVPEGSGEATTWNAGARGILEGCIWGMLEDSQIPANGMSLNKFTLNNIGNIVNKMSSNLADWLKARDIKTSRALTSAAMIVDNASDKTVGSYISHTQTLLKPYLTSGITYITSANDFEYDELVADEDETDSKPVALFITIPDENNVKFPIATLYTKQIYNFLIEHASKKEINHLKRKVYFYLDEFAQMPKFDDFTRWINASRSRWIFFNIIIQSVSQLNEKYTKDGASSILNGCQLHIFLGASDDDTVNYFYNKLGKETVIVNDISTNRDANLTMNYVSGQRMVAQDLVTKNKLGEINPGNIYFVALGHAPVHSTLIPYFNETCQKNGIFAYGHVNIDKHESVFSESATFYDISKVIALDNDTNFEESETSFSSSSNSQSKRKLQSFPSNPTNKAFSNTKQNRFENDKDEKEQLQKIARQRNEEYWKRQVSELLLSKMKEQVQIGGIENVYNLPEEKEEHPSPFEKPNLFHGFTITFTGDDFF